MMTYKQAIIVASASTASGIKFVSLFEEFFGGDTDWLFENDYLDEGE